MGKHYKLPREVRDGAPAEKAIPAYWEATNVIWWQELLGFS